MMATLRAPCAAASPRGSRRRSWRCAGPGPGSLRAGSCSRRGSSRPSPEPAKWARVPSTSKRPKRRVGSVGAPGRRAVRGTRGAWGRRARAPSRCPCPGAARRSTGSGSSGGVTRARALTSATAVPSPPAARMARGARSVRSQASISLRRLGEAHARAGRARAICTATRRPPRFALAFTSTASARSRRPARSGAGQRSGAPLDCRQRALSRTRRRSSMSTSRPLLPRAA